MSKDRNADLAALLKAVGGEAPMLPAEPELEASPFAIQLGKAIAAAIHSMRATGLIEVEDESLDALVVEVSEAAFDTKSPKQLVKRVIHTLIKSDRVEEVYGTDSEIGDTLTRLLGGD